MQGIVPSGLKLIIFSINNSLLGIHFPFLSKKAKSFSLYGIGSLNFKSDNFSFKLQQNFLGSPCSLIKSILSTKIKK